MNTTHEENLTVAQAEEQVREFAREFPTPNVLKAVELAETGRLSWFSVYVVCKRAISGALLDVTV